MIDVYASGIDAAGRFGAVFKRDDETAYFYPLDMRKQERSFPLSGQARSSKKILYNYATRRVSGLGCSTFGQGLKFKL